MSEPIEIRQLLDARADAETGTVEGYAVKYGEVIRVNGYRESFERGAFSNAKSIKLYGYHKEPIGKVIETEDREEGFFIRAKISDTVLGRDVLTLLRDEVLDKFSVGFVPVKHRDDNGVVVRTAVDLREVSVVPFPAYKSAEITAVREEAIQETENVREDRNEEIKVSENTDLDRVLSEVRELGEDVERRFALLTTERPSEPQVDTRSGAAFLKALVIDEDEACLRSYVDSQRFITDENVARAISSGMETRAYTGGTTADAPMQNQWVGDYTHFFDASSGILADTFATGTLPALGNTLEYAQEGTVTGSVAKQANEGDDLTFTKVTLTTKTTSVYTYGGYTQLSFQEIERSTLPILERNLENLTLQAAINKKAVLRADYDAVVAARRAITSNGGVILGGAAVASMTPAQWLSTVIAANKAFKAQGWSVDKLIVTEDVFASLINLSTTGDRVLRIAEGNSAGNANIGALKATLFGVPVEVDESPSSGVTTGQAVFVNKAAIRSYDSAFVRLQDSNVINLSKDFSIYRYGAIADERPGLILPVKFAAS